MKKIFNVKVITNAKRQEVISLGNDSLKIKLNTKPVDGKANKALIKLLADHFGVAKGNVRIVRGLKSRNKVVEVTSQ